MTDLIEGRKARKVSNPERICPECGEAFIASHGRQQFCFRETPPNAKRSVHAKRFYTRQAARGQIAVSLLQTWRWRNADVTPEDMAFAHKELCSLASVFNREDKAAGRKPYLQLQGRKNRERRTTNDNPYSLSFRLEGSR